MSMKSFYRWLKEQLHRLGAIGWARFRRWCYLLVFGIARREFAYTYTEFLNGKVRLVGIASGTRKRFGWKVWWRDPDNSIMELQDYWVKEHERKK